MFKATFAEAQGLKAFMSCKVTSGGKYLVCASQIYGFHRKINLLFMFKFQIQTESPFLSQSYSFSLICIRLCAVRFK